MDFTTPFSSFKNQSFGNIIWMYHWMKVLILCHVWYMKKLVCYIYLTPVRVDVNFKTKIHSERGLKVWRVLFFFLYISNYLLIRYIPEDLSFGEGREVCFENLFEVARIRRDDTAEVAEPWALKNEGSILAVEDLVEPFIEVGVDAIEKRREHAKDWPNG